MPIELGQIEALFRYPVKSMRGEALAETALGWHGLDGDRRFAFRRLDERGGFPWLTASKLPELLLYTPRLPGHVVTPHGEELPLLGDALAADVTRRYGAPVEMMQLNQGIFDDGTISVITSATIREISRLSNTTADVRRFRPNILLRSTNPVPFEENDWVGGTLTFGDGADAPAVTVTTPDLRCVMVNLDPDTAASSPDMLKSVARANDTNAGIYATVTRTGRLSVGQTVRLSR
jgi:hypothetical protein